MSIKSFASKLSASLKKSLLISIALALIASIALAPATASAAITNPAPKPQVSFTFDDGFQSVYTKAAPTLAKYGYTGTSYVTTGCIGMTTTPNTCRADRDLPYMTWDQVTAVQNTYGWEIGSHTATHPYMASFDAGDGQPDPLTPDQITQELVSSKQALTSRGFAAEAYASPYGDYDPSVLAEVAKYYTSHRGFADTGLNTWPQSDYLIVNQPVQSGVSVATVKGYVDQAITQNKWLVLTFHEIRDNPSSNPDDYQYSTANLDAIAAYVKSKNVAVTNVSNGIAKSDTNMLPDNGTFNAGITGGWTTDSPAQVTKDTANNGSYTDSTNSAKLVSSTKNTHLFSPKLSVANGTNYLIKNFLNVKKITGGEVGYYMDEYNSAGNWISGKWITRETTVFAQNLNFNYTPSSVNVKKASLQIYVTANSGVEAYVDNVKWFPLTDVPTPPAPVELLTNTGFESGLSGWTTDGAANITADATGKGAPSGPVNSVKLVSMTTPQNRHLFSAKVSVSSTGSYTISHYLNIAQRNSGGIGYYIDEYDANGNWISGQYKNETTGLGVTNSEIGYTPSSTNVAKASFQVIVSGGTSNIVAYIDNVSWVKND